MALGFFRNQQKLVIVIMVLLMIAFLIPSTLSMIGRGGGEQNPVIGSTRYGDLHHQDIRLAARELQILSRQLPVQNLAMVQQLPPDYQLAGRAFLTLMQQEQSALCYALLKQEAQVAEMDASEAEIDLFLGVFGKTDDAYRSFIGEIREQTGMGEDEIRQVVGNWLMVHKYFVASLPPTAPSLAEMRHQYEANNQQVKVKVYALSAEKFLPKVSMPSATEIQEHWKRYRSAPADVVQTPQSFGFGYLQPKQYIVDYLLLDARPLGRVVEVPDEAVRAYYNKNADRFTKVVERPSDDPNAGPDIETRQLSLAEAWEQVVEEVRPKLAVDMLDPLSVRVGALLREYRALPEKQKTVGAYQWVRDRLTGSAEMLLSRKVTVSIQNESLARAVEILAEEADLTDICYPWGEHGRLTLDPDTVVSLEAKGMTLGEALRRITAQIPDWPRMQWAVCTEIDQVLFPVSGVDLFPIRAQREELSRRELIDHEILGSAATAARQGRSLIRALLEMERMRQRQQKDEVVFTQGPEMLVFEETGPMSPPRVIGKVFWTLENIRPAQAPQTRTREMTDQVVRDIRLKKAYRMALADANGIDSDEELNALVRKHKLDPSTTPLFSRSQATGRGRQMFWSQVELDLPAVVLKEAFLQAAFGLIPPPEEHDRRPLTVLPIPATQTVAVLKLVDFRYPGEQLFDVAQYRRIQAERISLRRKSGLAQAWFNFRAMVARRVQWKAE
jgi:hypothetical protein